MICGSMQAEFMGAKLNDRINEYGTPNLVTLLLMYQNP